MGQKIIRSGCASASTAAWDSRWFSGKAQYGKLLHEDMKIRELLMARSSRRRSPDRHRAAAQEVPGQHPLGAAGRGDRQEGRRHRQAAQAGRQADPVGSRDQHRRGAQALRSTRPWSPTRSPSSSSAASRSVAR